MGDENQDHEDPQRVTSGLAAEVGKHQPFEHPEEELYLNLIRTAEVLSGEFDDLFRSHGISEPKYNAMRILAGREALAKSNNQQWGGVRCSDIASMMVSRVPDVTRLVDRLERGGFVSRSRSTTDRRVVRVTLTKAGHDVLAQLAEPVRQHHRAQFSHLTPDQIKTLNSLLFEARSRPTDPEG